MIEQANVEAADQTTPTIQVIRDRISQAVDATAGTALESLKFWLQMPADSMFTAMLDKDCQPRARRVAAPLSLEAGGLGLYQPSDLSVQLGVADRWTAIDGALTANRAVIINGSTEHVGGPKSKFNSAGKAGFHVIVFLAVGEEPSGRRYYLGFDPDVSATADSQAKWKPLVVGGTVTRAEKFTVERGKQIIKAMILGDSADGFGPLVRKYYVETDKAFPQIVRG